MKQLSLAIIAALSLGAHAEAFKIGGMSGQEADLLYAAQSVAKEKFNLEVEVVEFDDYVTPNIALADGDIDANAFQHGPYLDAMVRDRGFDLVAVANTFVYPIGAYSRTLKSLDELEEGMTIALPNDPSNGGRSYLLLDSLGVITLKDNTNLESSSLDVAENPKKLKFQEVDAAQLPRVLDEVDVAFINSNYAVNADLIPKRDAIAMESLESPYMNIIAVRAEDADTEAVKQFVQAYQSDAVDAAAQEVFKGAAVKGW